MLLNINIFNQDCHKSVIEMDVTQDFLVGVINYNDSTIENLLLFRAVADQEIIIWGLIGVNQEFSIGAIKWMDIKPNLVMSINKAKKLGIRPFTFNYQPEIKNLYYVQATWLKNHNLEALIPPNFESLIPPALIHTLTVNQPYTQWYQKALIDINNFYEEINR